MRQRHSQAAGVPTPAAPPLPAGIPARVPARAPALLPASAPATVPALVPVLVPALVLTLVLALCGVAPALAGLPGQAAVNHVVHPYVSAKGFRGLVVGLIGPDGRATFGYGTTKGKRGKRPDGATVFDIGSLTKTVTGILLAQAVMEGKIAITDPIWRYLPQRAAGTTGTGGAAEQAAGTTRPRGAAGETPPDGPFRAVTFLDLATHSSGLPERPDNMPGQDQKNPLAGYSREKLLDYAGRIKLQGPPGGDYFYSNAGAALAGLLLEDIHGRDYETLAVDTLFRPLGMSDTRVSLTEDMARRLAQGHDADGDPTPNWEVRGLEGAGALRSTADDLLTYAAANLGLAPSPLLPAMKLSHLARKHVAATPEMFLGLFWNVFNFDGREYLLHAGRAGGYFALLILSPADMRGVVVLANAAQDLTRLGWDLMETMTRAR